MVEELVDPSFFFLSVFGLSPLQDSLHSELKVLTYFIIVFTCEIYLRSGLTPLRSSSMNGEEGEDSNDECCICGTEWTVGSHGWVLCDTSGCPNTVCPACTSKLSLSVSELFYCPQCAGEFSLSIIA